jgi:hypothetical protein
LCLSTSPTEVVQYYHTARAQAFIQEIERCDLCCRVVEVDMQKRNPMGAGFPEYFGNTAFDNSDVGDMRESCHDLIVRERTGVGLTVDFGPTGIDLIDGNSLEGVK